MFAKRPNLVSTSENGRRLQWSGIARADMGKLVPNDRRRSPSGDFPQNIARLSTLVLLSFELYDSRLWINQAPGHTYGIIPDAPRSAAVLRVSGRRGGQEGGGAASKAPAAAAKAPAAAATQQNLTRSRRRADDPYDNSKRKPYSSCTYASIKQGHSDCITGFLFDHRT